MAAAPDDRVALHMLAAFAEGSPPDRASDDYVRLVFDRFAARFDAALANDDRSVMQERTRCKDRSKELFRDVGVQHRSALAIVLQAALLFDHDQPTPPVASEQEGRTTEYSDRPVLRTSASQFTAIATYSK